MAKGTALYPKKLRRLARAALNPGDTPYRRGPGSRPIMFVADYGDLFCEDVPDYFILDVLDVLWRRKDADWVLLTKRPQRMADVVDYWLWLSGLEILPPHTWCLTTTENQHRADERIPILLQVKAQVLGVSMEPMLEEISLKRVERKPGYFRNALSFFNPLGRRLNWVILGAESGADRRPFDVKWAYTPYEQCAAAGVPFFGKQDSGLRPGVPLLIDGKEIKEFPG